MDPRRHGGNPTAPDVVKVLEARIVLQNYFLRQNEQH
jgi:hypothetical protein